MPCFLERRFSSSVPLLLFFPPYFTGTDTTVQTGTSSPAPDRYRPPLSAPFIQRSHHYSQFLAVRPISKARNRLPTAAFCWKFFSLLEFVFVWSRIWRLRLRVVDCERHDAKAGDVCMYRRSNYCPIGSSLSLLLVHTKGRFGCELHFQPTTQNSDAA